VRPRQSAGLIAGTVVINPTNGNAQRAMLLYWRTAGCAVDAGVEARDCERRERQQDGPKAPECAASEERETRDECESLSS
jgi:hypothetical protein